MLLRSLTLLLLLVGLVAGSLAAEAAPPPTPKGNLIYVDKGSVWKAPVLDDSVAPLLLGRVPAAIAAEAPAELRSASQAQVVLLGYDSGWLWLRPKLGENREARRLACPGAPVLAPDGRCVACIDAQGKLFIERLDRAQRLIPFAAELPPLRELAFADGVLWASADDGLRRIELDAQAATLTPLLDRAPTQALQIAPDQRMAVGSFRDLNEEVEADGSERNRRSKELGDATLFAFSLVAPSAPRVELRRLNRAGVALSWSQDSQWLLVQEPKRACIVRASGGQYKCWKNFSAVALSPMGRFALLRRRGEKNQLYWVFVEGPFTAAARKLRTLSGAVAWIE